MYYIKLSIFFLSLCIFDQVQGGFFTDHARGWHWYEAPPVLEEKKKQEFKESKKDGPVALLTPSQRLQKFKKTLQARLDAAIVMPTSKNVKAYMAMQQVMMERAELFSQRWMEVLYKSPSLDYTAVHPVTQVGIHASAYKEKQEIEKQIKALARSHGLFFFFKAGCSYCHAFAPIVKSFSQKYGWKVLAISADGSSLPEFPDAVQDNGAAERLGVTLYPTLLAVSPQTEAVIPLSYGISSHDQIEHRLKVLLRGDAS